MSDTKYTVDDPRILAHMVAAGMQEGLWVFDYDRQLMHYGADFVDVFGPEGAPDGPGKPVTEIAANMDGKELEGILDNWNRLMETGERFRVRFQVRDRRGELRWLVSTIYAVLRKPDGAPERVIGFHMDMTDAIRNERDLAAAQEHLRMIFANAGIGMAMASTEGRLERVNPALARMLGREEDELVGRRLSDFGYADDGESLEANLTRLVGSGRNEAAGERRFLRPDGQVLWTNITATLSVNRLDGRRLVIVLIEDVTEKLRRRHKLQYDATHDGMTGAWSRWVLLERLGQHIGLALRHSQPLAFCMCDLDYFKRVNDRFGHQVGDQVLVEFVRVLQEAVRDTDLVGRYGGEEFGIVFPNTDVPGAMEAMHRARLAMCARTFRNQGGDPFRVTASFGLCGVEPDSAIRSMVAKADAALYEAKRLGRNCVVINEGGDFSLYGEGAARDAEETRPLSPNNAQ